MSLADEESHYRMIADLLQVNLADFKKALLHVVQITRGRQLFNT